MNTREPTLARPFFEWIVQHPKRVFILGLLVLIGFGSFLPQLWKDTRSDAFLADDNPALIYRDKVKETFGLSDPMVIAVVAEQNSTGAPSIFTPVGLNTIRTITNVMRSVDNIDPDGITSLSTENNIVGSDEGMDVEQFYDDTLSTSDQAHAVRDAIRDFPLYQGSLVANDESASLIVLEILDNTKVEDTYQAILEELETMELQDGITTYVAGEGAIAGFMGSYIDADAQRLNPLAGLVITIMLFIAFRRISNALMANLVVAASAITTLGAMAASNVPFFVITNALPVILIGISVADSIHIFSAYFERRARFPNEAKSNTVVESMLEMWRPITLTTLTTAAGFMGLYFAAYMPPFQFFGLFTAFGVSMAWIYSLIVLPAVMTLTKTEVHPKLAEKLAQGPANNKHDLFASMMVILGRFTVKNSTAVIIISLLVVAAGINSARQLVVNEDRIATFHPSEPLYQADKTINKHFDGTNNLDIVIETSEPEGIFEPAVLRKIEALQHYAESLPFVMGSNSVVDYLKQMNKSLNEGQESFYQLPGDKDLVAQYFLLYSASGEPTDFEEEVDFDYQRANVRVVLNSGAYVDTKDIVEALDAYLISQFNSSNTNGISIHANLSGRVNLNYHWIKDLGASHFAGMGIALFLVWLVSALLFRSSVAGIYTLIPIATSILFVYSAMVFFGISLGIGTSMFAAVAIGLGVDFAIHTIDRIKSAYLKSDSLIDALNIFYPSTGRALFFNLLSIALGFGVLISSKVVPLNNFGTIVALSVTTSFLVSMTLLPAMILRFKPRFIVGPRVDESSTTNEDKSALGSASILGIAAATIALASLLPSQSVNAEELPEGRWLAEQINSVDEGGTRTSDIQMILTDRRGKERVRETRVYRKYYGEEKRTVLFYLSPRNVKNTGFLTYDYSDEKVDDDQWLYLPALRKARRISASDRGDYFLGTDLSYEDMKKEGKLNLADYHFKTLGKQEQNGKDMLLLESIPANQTIAEELGYGKVHAWVDPSNWIIMRAKYWDINLNELKQLEIGDVRLVDGIWTRHQLKLSNDKTGHQTEWRISNVDYQNDINDKLFTKNALTRGAPRY